MLVDMALEKEELNKPMFYKSKYW